MDNFTSKIKQHRVLGRNLFLSFSIVLIACFIAGAGTRTDTLYTSGGAYLTRLSTPAAGITRANIDTSKTRHTVADSATIPVFKGAKTIRDTTTFTGGAYFAGIARFAGTLYAPVVDIDSMVGDVKCSGQFTSTKTGSNTGGGFIARSSAGVSFFADFNGDFSGNGYNPVLFGNGESVARRLIFIYKQNTPAIVIDSADGKVNIKTSLASIGTITAPSFVVGTGDPVSLCDVDSFTVTFTGVASSNQTKVYYQAIGKHVTLWFTPFSGTSSAPAITFALTQMPAAIRPLQASTQVLSIYAITGESSSPSIENDATNFAISPMNSSGTIGIAKAFAVTYLLY